MRRELLIAVLLAAGCRDQEKACRDAFGSAMRLPEYRAYYERCMREKWTDKKIDCMLRTDGTFYGMFRTCGE
jgi:hypothetical protein